MPVGQPTSTTQTYSCTVVTSDPASGTIEIAIPGNLENVMVISTPVAFRWPIAGETWRVEKVNGQFYLREPYPLLNPGTTPSTSTTATNTINTIEPGDAVINTPTGKVWILGSSDGSTDLSFGSTSPFPLHPIAAPATPSTGFFLYVDVADGKLKAKGSSGTVTALAVP